MPLENILIFKSWDIFYLKYENHLNDKKLVFINEELLYVLTAYAEANKFISQPIVHTETLCSITKVATKARSVPKKHISDVSVSWWFLYVSIALACPKKFKKLKVINYISSSNNKINNTTYNRLFIKIKQLTLQFCAFIFLNQNVNYFVKTIQLIDM